MAVLPLIKDPQQYRPCMLDLIADGEARNYWLDHFDQHLSTLEPLLYDQCRSDEDRRRVASFSADLRSVIRAISERPEDFAPLTILSLDQRREKLLRQYGFEDPYKAIKEKENRAALELYPALVGELATHENENDLIRTLMENIFAGNIFDLGSLATTASYNANGQDFFSTRRSLRSRPWLVDDCDALTRFILSDRYENVLFFVDNAGADLVLGCLPFAKYLAGRGSRVVLAANSEPTLNDVTYDELCRVLGQTALLDKEFAKLLDQGKLEAVASGNGTPLIDLKTVSQECARAASETDFLILEGMGRAVESNYHIEFTCPTLKIALLKDQQVAGSLGGRLYDPVCKFEL